MESVFWNEIERTGKADKFRLDSSVVIVLALADWYIRVCFCHSEESLAYGSFSN